jgi:hypothetical protein
MVSSQDFLPRMIAEPSVRCGSQGAYLARTIAPRTAAVNESIDASRWNQCDFCERPGPQAAIH